MDGRTLDVGGDEQPTVERRHGDGLPGDDDLGPGPLRLPIARALGEAARDEDGRDGDARSRPTHGHIQADPPRYGRHMDDLALLDEQTDLLLRTARAVEDDDAPSLCDGWTRGHVLSHLARNADGLARAATGVLDGSRASMYDSQESRDADIESGVGRTHADALADLSSSAAALREVLGRLGPEQADVGIPRLTDGPDFFTAARLPTMRLREVVYHHVDLDAGFGFEDLPADLLVRYLQNEVARYASVDGGPAFRIRTDEGDQLAAGEGGPLVTGSRGAVLLWLARQRPDGVRAGDGALPELPKGG